MGKKTEPTEDAVSDMADVLKSMTPAQIAYLKEQLQKIEEEAAQAEAAGESAE